MKDHAIPMLFSVDYSTLLYPSVSFNKQDRTNRFVKANICFTEAINGVFINKTTY